MAKQQRRTFGELVRAGWERSGMTQSEFARKLGVQQPRVAEIFRQESMTEALFVRCATALGLDIDVRLVKRRG